MSDTHRKIAEIFSVFVAVVIVGFAVLALWGRESRVFQLYQCVGMGMVIAASFWFLLRSPKD